MKTRTTAALLTLACVTGLIGGCATGRREIDPGLSDPALQPSVEREFRAAWIATVANINWPSEPGLSTRQQQQEALDLLDLLAQSNFNAAVFQVRPQCDAMYASQLEPWSYYLTSTQGKAPEPFYDPLAFWVEEAHKRGIELHVWLNPYRAHHPRGGEVTEHSIVSTRPELVVRLETGYYWMDPALQQTQDHSLAVVMDIVRRYDIDGVHFDDYFYPYPSYNNDKDFPDDTSWGAYQQGGGELSRGDWRRAAVDAFIERLYGEIKRTKAHVKFGLSPFGIWRPYNPQSIRGLDQFDVLYADARRWLNEGWVDYYSPQLYWPTKQIPQSFPVLLDWWSGENHEDRHLWPGINLGRGRDEASVDEVLNEIMITRGMLPASPGVVHWSIGALQNPELIEAVRDGPYRRPALVPASPWLDRKAPAPPRVSLSRVYDQLVVGWSHDDADDVFRWVVHHRRGKRWQYSILNRQDRFLSLQLFTVRGGSTLSVIEEVAVSAVDRVGNTSDLRHRLVGAIPPESTPTLESVLAAQSDARKPAPRRPSVQLGVDVLVQQHMDLIEGKRLGLITNPSAVGADFRSSVDILANTPEVDLVALFGTEHGVRGARQDRIDQDGEIDPITGVPVYSMYGDSFAPRQEWLQQLDVLLFDIQGVGSAWYTFKYSMSWAMEACAQAGIPFIVLDRPNPLGGRVVEGPMLNLGGIFRHALPLRHGMTYGELATMWNQTEGYGADLTVIRMQGWRRGMPWDDTGLLWVMPSPNMGTLETALVYPGQCLFERMNVSEGRGTTKPFLMVGAPWVDAEKAAADLNERNIPGAVFRPAHFIPRIDADTPNPRDKPWNQMCNGVEIMLTDYADYRSVEAALHIVDAFGKTSPGTLKWSPPAGLEALDTPGATVEQVIEQSQKDLEDFSRMRREFLLYR